MTIQAKATGNATGINNEYTRSMLTPRTPSNTTCSGTTPKTPLNAAKPSDFIFKSFTDSKEFSADAVKKNIKFVASNCRSDNLEQIDTTLTPATDSATSQPVATHLQQTSFSELAAQITMKHIEQHQRTNSEPSLLYDDDNVTWQEVRNTKDKRLRSPMESIRSVRQKTIGEYYTRNINRENRFQTLDNNEEKISETNNEEIESEKNTDSSYKEPKQNTYKEPRNPPPIFVPDVRDIKPLTNLLNSVARDGFELKTMNRNQIRIQSNSIENYGKISKMLINKKVKFHTYQLKQDKPFRVVLRIHHSVDETELKNEIQKYGHEVSSIYNIKHRRTKEPLSLFYIDLKTKENNKEIYNISHLQYTSVKFEEPHQKKVIPQCARCQRYGHTKGYCYRNYRCVKCANNHPTAECTKSRDTEATCALCNGKHPANYKGCQIYKEIQSRKFPKIRERRIQLPEHKVTSHKPSQQSPLQNHHNNDNVILHNQSPHVKTTKESINIHRNQPNNNEAQPSYANVLRHGMPTGAEENVIQSKKIEHLLEQLIVNQTRLSEDIRAMLNIITALISKMK